MMRLTRAQNLRVLAFHALAAFSTVASTPVLGQQSGAMMQGQQTAPAAENRPFPPLAPAAEAQLRQILAAWEVQSKGTKTLECTFQRWHFDSFAAPAGLHATKADGVIRYNAPDMGLFRVDRLVFFAGMKDEKPNYEPQPGQYGEHWVCNGQELLEFDRGAQECRIQQLPPEMRGKEIFNSPLPFVFNLDAVQVQERYWIREVQAPKPELIVLEAWPKRQSDAAQYKVVQIALERTTFLPHALIMYPPNFNIKTAPTWDQYQFDNVKRNSVGQGISKFIGSFIDEKPPANWKVLRDTYRPPAPDAPLSTAEAPAATTLR